MPIKAATISFALALLVQVHLAMLVTGKQTPAPSTYAQLEVRGKLAGPDLNNTYYIETSDGVLPSVKLRVKLERSEDKNRALDRYLESLKGKVVVVKGYLDGRRLAQENAVIYLYLSSQSQINPAGS